jgi:hypothetical protein
MNARRRTPATDANDTQRHDTEAPPQSNELQALAVYQTDLLAEVEGLLRTITKMQSQIERLRSGGDAGAPLSDRQRPEAVKLLVGNVRTLCSKVDTLRDTLPEILKTAEALSEGLDNAEEA